MKRLLYVALGAGLLLLILPGSLPAQEGLDPVLRILVKKGVLTLEEAYAVQTESDALEAQEAAARQGEAKEAVPQPIPPAPPAKPAVTTELKLGKGVTFSKGDMDLNITGRTNIRYHAGEEDALLLAKVLGLPSEGDKEYFDVRRARLTFQGHLRKTVGYKFQWELAGSGSTLRDAELYYQPREEFGLSVGQFKVPFQREFLASTGDLEFVDRSIVYPFFGADRDVGLMLHGRFLEEGKLHYDLGVFNGEYQNARNRNGRFSYAARLGYDPFGYYKPVESDFERSKDPKLAFAVDYRFDQPDGADEQESWGFDAACAYRGFYLDGEYDRMEWSPETGGEEFEADGWRLQAGYMVYEDLVELALRYAQIDADFPEGFVGKGPGPWGYLGEITAAGTGFILDDVSAWTLGLSLFFDGHANKLQINYTWVDEEGFGPDLRGLRNGIFDVQYSMKF